MSSGSPNRPHVEAMGIHGRGFDARVDNLGSGNKHARLSPGVVAELVSRVLLLARIASCVPAVIPLVLLPTPGLLGACSRARQARRATTLDTAGVVTCLRAAARAACAGLAPPKLVLGRGPARKREGHATSCHGAGR